MKWRQWCQTTNLLLNINKTKELAVDCRMEQQQTHTSLTINGTPVERARSFRYLGVHVSEDGLGLDTLHLQYGR